MENNNYSWFWKHFSRLIQCCFWISVCRSRFWMIIITFSMYLPQNQRMVLHDSLIWNTLKTFRVGLSIQKYDMQIWKSENSFFISKNYQLFYPVIFKNVFIVGLRNSNFASPDSIQNSKELTDKLTNYCIDKSSIIAFSPSGTLWYSWSDGLYQKRMH